MRAGILYFKLQCKKYSKILPLILAESFLFALLILLTGFAAVKMLGQGSSFAGIKVGVVSQEEESMTGLLISFVEGMDSFEENCSFVRMEEQEAYEALEAGELYAAVILPEGILEGILNGTNIPARVVLSRACSELETAVFEEVAGAGGRMLSVAQAGIYAADDLCLETGNAEQIAEAEAYLNEAYLDYALNRTAIFELEEVAATGKVGLLSYYGISLLLVFMTFAAVVAGRYAKTKQDAHTMLLSAYGLKPVWQYLCDVLAFTVPFTVAGSIIGCPVLVWCAGREGTVSRAGALCVLFVIVLFSVVLFIRMLLQFTGNNNGGMGSAFAALFAAMFVCGLFLPAAFLPVWTEDFAQLLPYSFWLKLLLAALQEKVQAKEVLGLVMGSLATILVGMCVFLIQSISGRREAGRT